MTEISHIEAIDNEYKQIEKKNAWNLVYQQVRSEGTYDIECDEARTAVNRALNRYRDVLPYDDTRIVLKNTNTTYINASLLKVASVDRQYILTQGPLSQSTPHFWLMVWQQKCKGIVMLNKIIEKNQIKCHQYWPLGDKSGGEDILIFASVMLEVELTSEVSHSHYVYRTFRLTDLNSKESRKILHFHYTTWPDFGVPQSPEAFYKFLNSVRSSGCLEPDVGPAVIHCSAGIGRSGTFCLVDSVLMMLTRGLCDAEPGKVKQVLLEMRRYRMGLIQTPAQLRFSYQAIVYGAHRLNETNSRDPSEESSSEETSLADEPPPPPPPRTDSLTRSMMAAELETLDTDADENSQYEDQDNEIENGRIENSRENNRGEENGPSRPLPDAPTGGTSVESSPATTPVDLPTDTMASEVRRRRVHDKEAAISAKVEAMKEKQRATDKWEERKRWSSGGEGAAKRPRV